VAYTPPNYNLLASLWTCDLTQRPDDGAPDWEDVPCQKYLTSRSSWPTTPPWTTGFYLAYHPPVILRFPRTMPFDGPWHAWKITCVEVPQGSGQYYRAFWGDVQHQGFPNEYAQLVCVQCDGALFAVPPAGGAFLTGIGEDACGNTPLAEPPPPVLPPGPWTPPTVSSETLLDNFADPAGTNIADHIADTGQTWTTGIGDLEISGTGSGLVADTSPGGQHWAVNNYAGSPQVPYIMGFYTPSSISAGFYMGAIVRATDENNWWAAFLEWQGSASIYWRLAFYHCTLGTPASVVAGAFDIELDPESPYQIRVDFDGAYMSAKLLSTYGLEQEIDLTDSTDMDKSSCGVWTFADATRPTGTIAQVNRQ